MLKELTTGAAALVLSSTTAIAAIYTCTDKSGRRHTADRPIPACLGEEHRVLKSDGSVKKVVPAAMSPQERRAADERARVAERERAERDEAIKRDRLLLRRYPTREALAAARDDALAAVRTAVELSKRRILQLQAERKPLIDEATFHEGKPLPATLKQKFDANDAMLKAQETMVQNQAVEIERINSRFNDEQQRLEPLWRGAAPGGAAAAMLAAPLR